MNLEDEASRFQGHMAKEIAAQMYEPRLMVMNFGSKAVISVPAGIALLDKFAPSWSNRNEKEIMQTPARSPAEYPSR